MNGLVLSLPDDPEALPAWLEQRLVGPDLGLLVAELTAVHGEPTHPFSLSAVLGSQRSTVLESGLAPVPRAALSRLLRQPALLLELQQMVLTEGGRHWDRIADSGDVAAAERVTGRVMRAIAAEATPARPDRRSRWHGAGYAATALATAAAVLAAVYLGGLRPPAGDRDVAQPPATGSNGWGFAKVKELPRDAGDAAVLGRLADLAAEWSKKRPENADGLARRLGEFRQGCSALLLAEDLPLSARQQQWLRLRCADWAAAIDAELRQLEATRDVAGVRAAADRTVAGIVQELRDRGAESNGA